MISRSVYRKETPNRCERGCLTTDWNNVAYLRALDLREIPKILVGLPPRLPACGRLRYAPVVTIMEITRCGLSTLGFGGVGTDAPALPQQFQLFESIERKQDFDCNL